MRLCDNCKREPESFQLDNGQTAWWLVVDSDDSIEYLLSDLTCGFMACIDKNGIEGKKLYCIDCVERIMESD